MTVRGLFIGIATVDLHYLSDRFPPANSKNRAREFLMATGGPATNAAVTFAHLGGHSRLYAAIGQHALKSYMLADLLQYGVSVVDLAPAAAELPPISSIISTAYSGERMVMAYTARVESGTRERLPALAMEAYDVVLLDGFQMKLAQVAAVQARDSGVPVVLDGGSWKEGLEKLLPLVDVAICSADFQTPDCAEDCEPEDVLRTLAARGVRRGAVTQGARPVVTYAEGRFGRVDVPQVDVVDTLGAGDVFHGAFCYYSALGLGFTTALEKAAEIAARSTKYLGARGWTAYKTEESDEM